MMVRKGVHTSAGSSRLGINHRNMGMLFDGFSSTSPDDAAIFKRGMYLEWIVVRKCHKTYFVLEESTWPVVDSMTADQFSRYRNIVSRNTLLHIQRGPVSCGYDGYDGVGPASLTFPGFNDHVWIFWTEQVSGEKVPSPRNDTVALTTRSYGGLRYIVKTL